MNYDYRGKPYNSIDPLIVAFAEYPHRYFPILCWAIESQKDKNDWIDIATHMDARVELCKLQVEIIMGANINRLIASTEATYRLLNATFNGQSYTSVASGTEPSGFLTTPAIPQSPAAYNQLTAQAALALRALVSEDRDRELAAIAREEARRLLLVAIDAKLAQILATDNTEELADIIAKLGAILALL